MTTTFVTTISAVSSVLEQGAIGTYVGVDGIYIEYGMIADMLLIVTEPATLIVRIFVAASTTAIPAPCSDTEPHTASHPLNAINVVIGTTGKHCCIMTCVRLSEYEEQMGVP